ncbi:hypothetical protein ACJX0J_005329, partial [Zea mays]
TAHEELLMAEAERRHGSDTVWNGEEPKRRLDQSGLGRSQANRVQDDWVRYAKMTEEIGEQLHIVGDDLVTNPTVSIFGTYGLYERIDESRRMWLNMSPSSLVIFKLYSIVYFKKLIALDMGALIAVVKEVTDSDGQTILFIDEIHKVVGAASIARKIYQRQDIGVGGFQKIYGGCTSSASARLLNFWLQVDSANKYETLLEVDIVIIHGIVLLDVLDKELITYAIRILSDEELETYLKVIAVISMGTEVIEHDLLNIRELYDHVLALLYDYLRSKMNTITAILTALDALGVDEDNSIGTKSRLKDQQTICQRWVPCLEIVVPLGLIYGSDFENPDLNLEVHFIDMLVMVVTVGLESTLVGEDLNDRAFVYGFLSFLDKISCVIVLFVLELYEGWQLIGRAQHILLPLQTRMRCSEMRGHGEQ